MESIVLYAVGSPLVAEVEESCRRLNLRIAAAVRNIDAAHHLLDAAPLCELAEIDAAILRIACMVPLFTPANRQRALAEAAAKGFSMAPALVDPTAIVASSAALGEGCYVNAGAVIGAAARLDPHVFVNRAASLGHHVAIGTLASIGPGAVLAGQVRVGPGAMIGAGAILLPQVEIGAGSVIGAGALVTKNVPAGSLALGNPAKVVETGLPRTGHLAATATGSV